MLEFPFSQKASHTFFSSSAIVQLFILPPCLLLPLLSLPFISNTNTAIILTYLRHNSQNQRRTFTAGCPPYVRAGYSPVHIICEDFLVRERPPNTFFCLSRMVNVPELPPRLLLPLLSLPFFSNIIKEIIISYL